MYLFACSSTFTISVCLQFVCPFCYISKAFSVPVNLRITLIKLQLLKKQMRLESPCNRAWSTSWSSWIWISLSSRKAYSAALSLCSLLYIVLTSQYNFQYEDSDLQTVLAIADVTLNSVAALTHYCFFLHQNRHLSASPKLWRVDMRHEVFVNCIACYMKSKYLQNIFFQKLYFWVI